MICFLKNIHVKKGYYSFLQNFQSILSLHALKLALNKSMRTSDDEQGINRLRPKPFCSCQDSTYIKSIPLKSGIGNRAGIWLSG